MGVPLCLLYLSLTYTIASANLIDDVEILYDADHKKLLDDGQQLQLSLEKSSGSGFQSKREYLFGKMDMKIKLVPGYSAGTVSTFYLSSQGPRHDEVDFEFLGRVLRDPYIMQTNVFSQGQGNREVKFSLWFDPTKDFHNYSLLWNPHQIIFSVDEIPVRVFYNREHLGVAYPKNQTMRIYSTIWNGDAWATRGGKVKIDWSKAPFIASFANYTADACLSNNNSENTCSDKSWWSRKTLSIEQKEMLLHVREKYMIYEYCSDIKRFPQGLPPECTTHD